MPNRKISELAEYTTPDFDNDLLVIVDVATSVTKRITPSVLASFDPRRLTNDQRSAAQGSVFGSPPSSENPFVTADDPRVGGTEWNSIAHGSCLFTSNSGTWTVDSGDLAYFKWIRLNGTTIAIKGAIVSSTVSGAGSELRLTPTWDVLFGTNDSFGFTVWSVDGFGTQDVGQSISRAANEWLAFKRRDGAAWGTATDQVAVIWNLIVECTFVPAVQG
jgi:hypothetical protein